MLKFSLINSLRVSYLDAEKYWQIWKVRSFHDCKKVSENNRYINCVLAIILEVIRFFYKDK